MAFAGQQPVQQGQPMGLAHAPQPMGQVAAAPMAFAGQQTVQQWQTMGLAHAPQPMCQVAAAPMAFASQQPVPQGQPMGLAHAPQPMGQVAAAPMAFAGQQPVQQWQMGLAHAPQPMCQVAAAPMAFAGQQPVQQGQPMGPAHAPQPMGQVAAAPMAFAGQQPVQQWQMGLAHAPQPMCQVAAASMAFAGQQPVQQGLPMDPAYVAILQHLTQQSQVLEQVLAHQHQQRQALEQVLAHQHQVTFKGHTLQQSSMQIGRNVNQMMTMVLEASCHLAHSAMVQSDMLQQSQAVMVAQQRQAFVHAQPAPSTEPTQEQHTRPQGANPLPSPPKTVLDRVRRRREALKNIPQQIPQLTGVPVTDEAEVGVNQVHGTIIQMVHVRHNTKPEMKVITLPSSPVYDPSILDDWDNGLKVAPKHGGGRVAPLRYLELANTQVTKMWAFAINCNKNRCYWKGIVYALHMRVTGGEIQSPVEGVEGAAQVPMDLAAAKEHLLATCNIQDDDEGVSKLARASADAVMNWAPKDYEKRLQIKDLVLSMCSLTSSEWYGI
eukprot:gene5497-5535_t